VTVTRRILGLVPNQQIHLQDVTSFDSSSGTSRVTDRSGRTTSTYQLGHVELTTRGGNAWRSPEIPHAIGPSAEEIENRLEAFIVGEYGLSLTIWSIPSLSNIVGIPFALVPALFI